MWPTGAGKQEFGHLGPGHRRSPLVTTEAYSTLCIPPINFAAFPQFQVMPGHACMTGRQIWAGDCLTVAGRLVLSQHTYTYGTYTIVANCGPL